MLRFRLREMTGRWEVEHGESLTLERLSKATGISASTLVKIGDPRGYVTASRHIEILCRFFEVTPDELIVFDPPLKPGRPDDDATRPNAPSS